MTTSEANVAEHNVAVLGATAKPGRFSHQAVIKLKKHGYNVLPLNPRFEVIEGFPVYRELKDLPQPVHTLTLYVGASKLDSMVDEVLAAKPLRVIFNPGTESRLLQQALSEAGVEWMEDCTLIMLDSNKF